MAEPFIKLALKGASYGIENYEKVYEPLKARVKTLHPIAKHIKPHDAADGSRHRDHDEEHRPSPVDRSGPRREHSRAGGSGGAGPGYIKETYYREHRRAKSAGRDAYNGVGESGWDRGRQSRRDEYDSDSESSASPPPRRPRGSEKYDDRDEFAYDRPRRAQTYADSYSQGNGAPAGYIGMDGQTNRPSDSAMTTRRDPAWTESRGGKRSSSTSSSSSATSTLPSSSEDERQIKKMKGKEYLSAGLAAIATIHAARGVISSLEARDKRHQELLQGEITPEEARRKRNKLRLQDAAAIGIAALGIKGAYSEWQDVQETRKEVKRQDEERKKRHEKRLRRLERQAREARNRRKGERDRYGDDDDRDHRDGYRSA
jgi:hypothetical protein